MVCGTLIGGNYILIGETTMNIEERMAEIAQAYCTDRNSHKVMDSELMIDAKEIAIHIA